MRKLSIYLDFEGTIVEQSYYHKKGSIRCNFGCFEVIKKLQDAGHKFVLNSYRVELPDDSLREALRYINEDHWMFLKSRDERDNFRIEPIAEHTAAKINPQVFDVAIIKSTGYMFIDDHAHGIPLKRQVMAPGNMVDWDKLDEIFQKEGFYTKD